MRALPFQMCVHPRPCAHLDHGLMTVTMLVVTVMKLLTRVVTPRMEVTRLVKRVMAWR